MAGKFRESALRSLNTPQVERPRTKLVPPRRWLIALAVIAIMLAGLKYVAVTSLRPPVRGFGVVDAGGVRVVTAPEPGTFQLTSYPGAVLEAGEQVGEIIAADGSILRVTAPSPGVLMQVKGPPTGWLVEAGEPIFVIQANDRVGGPILDLYLPGIEATELTAGAVVIGGELWFETASLGAIACLITRVDPYPVPSEDILRFTPDPVISSAVRDFGSVLLAEADCPGGALSSMLPGAVAGVVVEVETGGAMSSILGTG